MQGQLSASALGALRSRGSCLGTRLGPGLIPRRYETLLSRVSCSKNPPCWKPYEEVEDTANENETQSCPPGSRNELLQLDLSAGLFSRLLEVPAEKQPPKHGVSAAPLRDRGQCPVQLHTSFSPQRPCEQPATSLQPHQ